MNTPFDQAVAQIADRGYHNHRKEDHSDIVSQGVLADLLDCCPALSEDLESRTVKAWYNVRAPGGRKRKADLFVGEPSADGVAPDIQKMRIALENKSVVTAHRNRTNRFDDLDEVLRALLSVRSEAVVIATVLVGLAERVLNVPDRVHPLYKHREEEFQATVLPRLSKGDSTLWSQFDFAVSENRPGDPRRTVGHLRELPTRDPAHTHVVGYDCVLLVPVYIDNVNPPSLPRPNSLGIDVDADYKAMLDRACRAYTARWHL